MKAANNHGKKTHDQFDDLLVQNQSTKQCRICLEYSSDFLIAPCLCRGTIKFAHQSCLKIWLLQQYKEKNKPKCEICNFEFKIKSKLGGKIDFQKGLEENFNYCIGIPIIITILLILPIIFFILVSGDHIESDFSKTEFLVAFILFVVLEFSSLIFLIFFVKNSIYFRYLKDITIASESKQSLNVKVEESTSS